MTDQQYILLNEAFRNAFSDMFHSCRFRTEQDFSPIYVMGGSSAVAHTLTSPAIHTVQLTLMVPKSYEQSVRDLIHFSQQFSPISYTYSENYTGHYIDATIIYKTVDSEVDDFINAIQNANWKRWNAKISADIDRVIND